MAASGEPTQFHGYERQPGVLAPDSPENGEEPRDVLMRLEPADVEQVRRPQPEPIPHAPIGRVVAGPGEQLGHP